MLSKDVKALINTAKSNDVIPRLIESVDLVNHHQKLVIPEKIVKLFGENLTDFNFCIWGLSFKPETDDMRESPSISIIDYLSNKGSSFQVYDPSAMEQAKKVYLKKYKNVKYFKNKYDALKNCDALIHVTEWKEFSSPDFKKVKKLLKHPVIFDGRNQYSSDELKELGFRYFQIGKK